jgi:L-phenylalanine/L-methionine N-acetyltransferase
VNFVAQQVGGKGGGQARHGDGRRQRAGEVAAGAGHGLTDAADRWLGILRIELTVFTDNARAIALYRRYGFVLEGTHRAYALRDGAYADVHAMARLHPNPPRLPSS